MTYNNLTALLRDSNGRFTVPKAIRVRIVNHPDYNNGEYIYLSRYHWDFDDSTVWEAWDTRIDDCATIHNARVSNFWVDDNRIIVDLRLTLDYESGELK